MKNLLSICLLLASSVAFGQSYTLMTRPYAGHAGEKINAKFSQFALYHIDVSNLYDHLNQSPEAINLTLPFGMSVPFDITMAEKPLLSDDFYVTTFDASGKRQESRLSYTIHTLTGRINSRTDSKAVMTVDPTILYLSISDGTNQYFIEPARNYDIKMALDVFIFYAQDGVISSSVSSLADEVVQKREEISKNISTESSRGCRGLICELAIASDFSMSAFFGVSGSITHNVNIMNMISGHFLGVFSDDIIFRITTQFVSPGTTSATNPWPFSPSGDTYFDNFQSWAISGGFGSASYDLGQCWTRETLAFSGGHLGSSNSNAICGADRYHIIITNHEIIPTCRQAIETAHHIGHNFGATDTPFGGTDIMSPSLNCNTTGFAPASVTQINSILLYPLYTNCMQQCSASDLNIPPPSIFGYLCSGQGAAVCKTFGPCIRDFIVNTTDPYLVINVIPASSSSNARICISSQRIRKRTTKLTVTAIGYCGTTGPVLSWPMNIDDLGCGGIGGGGLQAGVEERTVSGSDQDNFSAQIIGDQLILTNDALMTAAFNYQVVTAAGRLLYSGKTAEDYLEFPVSRLQTQVLFVKMQSVTSNKVYKLLIP